MRFRANNATATSAARTTTHKIQFFFFKQSRFLSKMSNYFCLLLSSEDTKNCRSFDCALRAPLRMTISRRNNARLRPSESLTPAPKFGHLLLLSHTLRIAPVKLMNHPRHISPRLPIRRNSMPVVYCSRTRVIRGQLERQTVVIFLQQSIQIGRSAVDVFSRSKAVIYAQISCCLRHELHQTLGSSAAYGMRIAAALGPHHAG